MFKFIFREKFVQEALGIIHKRIDELKEENSKLYQKLEGYAKAADRFDCSLIWRNIEENEAKLHELELLRIDIEYM